MLNSVRHAALEEIILAGTHSRAPFEMVNTPPQAASLPQIHFALADASMQLAGTFFAVVSPLDSGSRSRSVATPWHATNADTPTQSNPVHTGANDPHTAHI